MPDLPMHALDRRRHPRQAVSRPCKVRYAGVRYAPGVTHDLSGGGALVTIHTARRLRPGDELELGIAWAGSALIPERAMTRCAVVRALEAEDGRVTLALRFAPEVTEELAAAA